MPVQRTSKGGTRGTVFREVARLRIEDAKSLSESARYNGSIYLAGYTIECQLKYAYCKRKKTIFLPAELEVHDWDSLVEAAGLWGEIQIQPQMAALYSALAELWGPTLRYRTKAYSRAEGLRLYSEMKQPYQFINELEP
jgi:hypothetical protein